MKKVLATILAFIYLTAATGATINFHYCMDKLVAWGFGKENQGKKACPYCAMAKSNEDKHCGKQNKGCCKDEQKQIKIGKDQEPVISGLDFSKPLIQLAPHILPGDFFAEHIFLASIEYPVTHAPPRAENISLFLRNCVYRI